MTREEHIDELKRYLKGISKCMVPASSLYWKWHYEEIIKALEQKPVLDKIRAEIETKYGQCKLTEHIVQYDGICTSVNDIGDIADILQIIDKYKAETEGT